MYYRFAEMSPQACIFNELGLKKKKSDVVLALDTDWKLLHMCKWKKMHKITSSHIFSHLIWATSKCFLNQIHIWYVWATEKPSLPACMYLYVHEFTLDVNADDMKFALEVTILCASVSLFMQMSLWSIHTCKHSHKNSKLFELLFHVVECVALVPPLLHSRC